MPGPIEEAAARAALAAMAPRLGEPPHALLGVAADAPPAELRAAFLRLTKRYHPTRFARFSPDVVRLANEVFLTIKRAYDQLAAASAVPRPTSVASGTGAVAQRRSGTIGPPNRMATTPGSAVPARARPPATVLPRARTVQGPAPAPAPARSTVAPPSAAAPADPFEAAMDLLRRKLWGEARQAFQKLAVAVPQDKRYRAHMHYARGREAIDAGRADEARAELQRALALVPDLERAKIALRELSPDPGPGGGLWNKIFKR